MNFEKTQINSDDYRISFAIIFQLCLLITNYTIKYIFLIQNTMTRQLFSLMFMLLGGYYFIINLKSVFIRIGYKLIITYILVLSCFLYSILYTDDNTKYIFEVSFWTIFICLPVYFFYGSIINKSIFLKLLRQSAYYQLFIGIVFFAFVLIREISYYDMTFSYQIMVPIIILVDKLFEKFNIFDFILVIIGMIMLIAVGSRGPLLSVLIATILFIFSKYKSTNNKILFIAFSFICIFFLILKFDMIINIIIYITDYIGLSSRSLRILLAGSEIDFLTGRGSIYGTTLTKISNQPFFGYGIAGDRVFLNGTYPHNIFLELLVHFGVIIGGLLIISLLILSLNCIFFEKDSTIRNIGIIFFSVGFVGLVFSGSYLEKSNFWIFLSCSIYSWRRKWHPEIS